MVVVGFKVPFLMTPESGREDMLKLKFNRADRRPASRL